jgi:hypothetical protein
VGMRLPTSLMRRMRYVLFSTMILGAILIALEIDIGGLFQYLAD